jgi:hypothetical protein
MLENNNLYIYMSSDPADPNFDIIKTFNSEYDEYKKINRLNTVTSDSQIIETTNILNREHTFLFIWFIIALIVVIVTVYTILSNELNNYILYPTLGFLIFIIFYIFKNIYIYFNESIQNE